MPTGTPQEILSDVHDAASNALRVTGGGGGTQYVEDTAHVSGDQGNVALVVRKDVAGALAGTDGDYSPLQVDSGGALRVTGGGGGTQYNDGDARGTATGSLTLLDDGVNVQSASCDTSGRQNVNVATALPAGTNNIGDVDVLTLPALPAGTNNIGDVDVITQPARAATTDTITVKLATDAIQNGTTALTPKYAVIDAALSGDNTLVAAVTSKKIRVLALFVVAAGAVNVRLESGAAGTALTGQMNLTTNSGFVLPFNPVGLFETAVTTLLNLELSAAISVDGSLTYVEV